MRQATFSRRARVHGGRHRVARMRTPFVSAARYWAGFAGSLEGGTLFLRRM